MRNRRRRLRLGVLATLAGGLLLCCVVPFAGFDLLSNQVAGAASPVIPQYPHAQRVRQRVERQGIRTHRTTLFQTADAQAAVIAFYDRGLGPPNGKWHQTRLAHYPYNPRIARTWEYDDYCPDTLVDLSFAPAVRDGLPVAGVTEVEVTVTQQSCRDMILEVIFTNLFPWAFR